MKKTEKSILALFCTLEEKRETKQVELSVLFLFYKKKRNESPPIGFIQKNHAKLYFGWEHSRQWFILSVGLSSNWKGRRVYLKKWEFFFFLNLCINK
jgi:hypothetical protein